MSVLRLRLSDRTVDLEHAVVRTDDAEWPLTQTEVAALRYLGERAGADVSREALEREVWGFRAGVRSEAVPVAMRRLRQKLEPEPAEAAHLLTVPGVGWRLVATPIDAPSAADAPGGGSPFTPLPSWLDSFVGRSRERALLDAALDDARLVTVTGPGGVGKTRLCAEHAADRPGAVAFAALADARSRPDARGAVLAALGLPADGGADAERVGAHLAGAGPLLLVLDNTEQIAGLGKDVAAWLARAPGLRVLATSRRPLGVRGERLVPLAPLAANGDDARRLFLDRARAADPWADLDTPAARGAVARLVELLDGLPLALELAAVRVRVLEPRELVAREEDHHALLRDVSREERHSTLDRALDWSWSLLEPQARDALAQLALFEGPFDMADAEAVVDVGAHAGAPSAVDVVQQLVEHSLVAVRHDARPRLFLLVAVRAHARRRAPPDPAGRARHATWFARWGDAGQLRETERDDRARAGLVAAVGDLSAAAAWALDAGRPDLAGRCAVAAAEARRLAGPAAEGLALCRRVAALPLESDLAARLDLGAALLASKAGAPDDAREAVERARARAVSDDVRLLALLVGARVRQQAGDPAMGALAAEGLALAQALGDTAREADLRKLLVDHARVAGDLDAAEAHGRRALELHRAAGFVEGEANLLVTLGNVVGARGDLAGGANLLGEGLAKLRALRRPLSLTIALLNTGIMLARLARRAEARPLLEESLGLARRMADPHLEAYGLGNLGLLLVEDGLPEAAEAPLRRAVEMAVRGGWRAVEGSARGSLAEVLVARAALVAACEELDLAVDAMAGAGHRMDELRLLVRAAEVRALAGDDAGADLRAERARALARALGDAAAPYAAALGKRGASSSPRG